MTVEIDRPEPEAPGPQRPRRRILFGVMAAVAVVFGVAWVSGPVGDQASAPPTFPSAVVSTTTTTTTPTPTTTPTTSTATELPPTYSVTRRPLAECVPGLTGQLVTLQGQNLSLLITRQADTPEATIFGPPPAQARNVSFDASGDLMALVSPFTGWDRLYLRDESNLTDTTLLVTSYAWHDIQPAQIAAVVIGNPGDNRTLATFSFDDAEQQLSRPNYIVTFDSPRYIREWNESGFILVGYDEVEGSPFVESIDPNGEMVWRQITELLDVSSTGDILIGDFVDTFWELRIVNSDQRHGKPGEVLTWAPSDFTAVRWSTSGQMIAFLEPTKEDPDDWGLQIYDPDGVLLHSEAIPWRVWDIQWSPDDRYILMPGTDNEGTHAVIFYDTHTNSVSVVDDSQDWIQWSDLRD